MPSEVTALILIVFGALILVVACGTLLLKLAGFSMGKSVLITLTFLFCGIWNPIGWIVLIACIWLQYNQTRAKLLERAPNTELGSNSLVLPRRV